MSIFIAFLVFGFAYLYFVYIRHIEKESRLGNDSKEIKNKRYKHLLINSPQNLYVAKSRIPGAGRGVFAGKEIKKGEIIEMCPVIDFTSDESLLLRDTVLENHFFLWNKKQQSAALCLGFGSLYNHSSVPNAKWIKIPEMNVIQFNAIRDIQKDEEITHNYGWDPQKRSQFGF